jgi:hypothetical protein
LIGLRADDCLTAHASAILRHRRDDEERFQPFGELALAAGDLVTVQAEPKRLRDLHKLNGS